MYGIRNSTHKILKGCGKFHVTHNLVFLNQAHASRRPARAWFLKIDPVQILGMRVCVCACVCVCVCVSAPEAINN